MDDAPVCVLAASGATNMARAATIIVARLLFTVPLGR
jgi:hypothetical protein